MAIHKSNRRTVVLFSAASIVLLSFLVCVAFWFGFALKQHESVGTPTIVANAARLEWTGSDIVLLAPAGVWLKRAYKQGMFQQNGDALDQLLAQRGWTHIDQEGSGRVYTNGKRTLQVNCHMFSAHYEVCSAQSAW